MRCVCLRLSFRRYSLRLHMVGWPGWVELQGYRTVLQSFWYGTSKRNGECREAFICYLYNRTRVYCVYLRSNFPSGLRNMHVLWTRVSSGLLAAKPDIQLSVTKQWQRWLYSYILHLFTDVADFRLKKATSSLIWPKFGRQCSGRLQEWGL